MASSWKYSGTYSVGQPWRLPLRIRRPLVIVALAALALAGYLAGSAVAQHASVRSANYQDARTAHLYSPATAAAQINAHPQPPLATSRGNSHPSHGHGGGHHGKHDGHHGDQGGGGDQSGIDAWLAGMAR